MKLFAILMSFFSSGFIFAENIVEEKSKIECLSQVDGKPMPGLKGIKDASFIEVPCFQGEIDYCERLVYKFDIIVCKTKCCLKTPKPTIDIVHQVLSSPSAPPHEVKQKHEKKDIDFDESSERDTSKNSQWKFSKSVGFMVCIIIICILLTALIICGIFLILHRRKINKLQRMIDQPIMQPLNSETRV